MKISLAGSLAKLPLPATEKWPQGVWDVTALKHGTMSLLLFAPICVGLPISLSVRRFSKR